MHKFQISGGKVIYRNRHLNREAEHYIEAENQEPGVMLWHDPCGTLLGRAFSLFKQAGNNIRLSKHSCSKVLFSANMSQMRLHPDKQQSVSNLGHKRRVCCQCFAQQTHTQHSCYAPVHLSYSNVLQHSKGLPALRPSLTQRLASKAMATLGSQSADLETTSWSVRHPHAPSCHAACLAHVSCCTHIQVQHRQYP